MVLGVNGMQRAGHRGIVAAALGALQNEERYRVGAVIKNLHILKKHLQGLCLAGWDLRSLSRDRIVTEYSQDKEAEELVREAIDLCEKSLASLESGRELASETRQKLIEALEALQLPLPPRI